MEILKRQYPDVMIVVGGAGPSQDHHRHLFHKNHVDYFVIGEGEIILYELLKKIEGKTSDFIEKKCLCWRDDASDRTLCIKSSVVPNVYEIPFPTFEEFNIDDYTDKGVLPIITSRGCVNACHFCSDWPLKRPFRCRRPDTVVEEIRYLIQRYGRRRFEFNRQNKIDGQRAHRD